MKRLHVSLTSRALDYPLRVSHRKKLFKTESQNKKFEKPRVRWPCLFIVCNNKTMWTYCS